MDSKYGFLEDFQKKYNLSDMAVARQVGCSAQRLHAVKAGTYTLNQKVTDEWQNKIFIAMLGADLTVFRQHRYLDRAAMARLLGFSTAKLYAMEKGSYGLPDQHEISLIKAILMAPSRLNLNRFMQKYGVRYTRERLLSIT